MDTSKPSRFQRRLMEKINDQVNETHNFLAEKFLNYIITCDDPESDLVQEKAKQVSLQWRLFCKTKNLKPEAFPLMDEFCNSVIDEYKQLKTA